MNNTPCTEVSFKVGDKFRVLKDSVGFHKGQIVTLFRDDGSNCPLFAGENDMYTLCSGSPGAYLSLFKDVSKIEESSAMEMGYEVGDKFTLNEDRNGFKKGQVVELYEDDGSHCPLFRGDNAEYNTCCDGEPGAYLALNLITKLEDFQAGDLVTISNIRCSVLQRRYNVNQVCELIRPSDSEDDWLAQFSHSKGLDNDRSSNQFYVGGDNCDITPVPPIPEPEQVEMRRVVTTITMTQDVPLDEFDPEFTTIECMQAFTHEIIDEDLDEDVDIVVTKVSVELVANEA